MDISFFNSNEIPLPPKEVRIRKLLADPWPDGRRVRVLLEVDPSQKPPSADLTITDVNGKEVATASIIENVARHTEINLHLRGAPLTDILSLHVVLYYFAIDEPQANNPLPDVERQVVDKTQITFSLTSSEN